LREVFCVQARSKVATLSSAKRAFLPVASGDLKLRFAIGKADSINAKDKALFIRKQTRKPAQNFLICPPRRRTPLNVAFGDLKNIPSLNRRMRGRELLRISSA
jgi:hypothetical protein